ncbi:hypothetical protein SK803_04230 [Lentzea sp. BCCO 10_0856]|uniref:Uncharacterized protein n=1 Tax=Lentzea miocenica TaxID=3095431 RepID=A0ABU4SU12_9PSEU|nr:hypothetical protein [Lentzea sp. BCCO 10_0856]MDX8029402.1 hypothetical protein [Lentzea sp. BCCO 10_0856]
MNGKKKKKKGDQARDVAAALAGAASFAIPIAGVATVLGVGAVPALGVAVIASAAATQVASAYIRAKDRKEKKPPKRRDEPEE